MTEPVDHIAARAYEAGWRAGREAAAAVLARRAIAERNRCEQHKASAKHYKAREAAHVARIAEQEAAAIRALAPPSEP